MAWWDTALALALATLLSFAALTYCLKRGYILYYGDAEAHLNIARRIVESRTPGIDQFGTVWLPLPHALMLPLVADDALWRSGLAGAIPSAICFVLSVTFLFASAKMAFDSRAAGVVAAAAFALNPNTLYLQSTPMTEPVFFACLTALLYSTVRFFHSPSLLAVVAAGIAACAATLTRYEGWFLLPFTAAYFLVAAKRRRVLVAALFSLVAAMGPLAWLAHNWWQFGNALEFYNGPHAPWAIQGNASYPGLRNWSEAWKQFRTAAWLCAGTPLVWLGCAGVVASLVRRTVWPLIFLLLPAVFVVWSVHSGGTPIFVPNLWPHSYYNTRYGMALLPLFAIAEGALVSLIPSRFRPASAVLMVLASIYPWLRVHHEEIAVTWKEAQINSTARRAWTSQAAAYLKTCYKPGSGVLTTFGDVTGVYREAGIPLRDTLTWDNGPHWLLASTRPGMFLREGWALAFGGDPVQTAVLRSWLRGPRYTLQQTISVKGAPVVEIYRFEWPVGGRSLQ